MNQLSKHAFLVVLVGLTLASTAAAQEYGRPMIGPQIGFATNDLDFFVGGQLSYPVAKQIDLYPSIDIYFPGNNFSAWTINAEGRYWVKLNTPNPGLYVGGGLNYTHSSSSVPGFSHSNSDVGLGLLGGWDFKEVNWRPFAQIHIVIGDADRIEFGGGVNFKL